MAASGNLCTDTGLAALDSVDTIRAWRGASQEVWDAFIAALGTVETVIVLSLLPVDVFKRTLRALRILRTGLDPPERELTAVETIQLAMMMMWPVARQRQGAPVDPLQPTGTTAALPSTPPGATPGQAAGGTPARAVKNVKCGTVLDQGDETESRHSSVKR